MLLARVCPHDFVFEPYPLALIMLFGTTVTICAWLNREQSELSLAASLVWSLCDLERKILFVECQVYEGATKQGNTHC